MIIINSPAMLVALRSHFLDSDTIYVFTFYDNSTKTLEEQEMINIMNLFARNIYSVNQIHIKLSNYAQNNEKN